MTRALLLAVLLVAGCSSPDGDLASARQRWEQQEPAAYAYTYRAAAQTAVEARVTVRDGRVSVQVLDGDPALLTPELVRVESVFDAVAEALRGGGDVQVEYDDALGHPRALTVDPDGDTVDDEYGVRLRDLVVERR